MQELAMTMTLCFCTFAGHVCLQALLQHMPWSCYFCNGKSRVHCVPCMPYQINFLATAACMCGFKSGLQLLLYCFPSSGLQPPIAGRIVRVLFKASNTSPSNNVLLLSYVTDLPCRHPCWLHIIVACHLTMHCASSCMS